MTVSIQFKDDYILDLADMATCRPNGDTGFLEVTVNHGLIHRKQCFALDTIKTYSIESDISEDIVK